MDYSTRQHGFLWIIQTILACSIVVCLLNPIFRDIYVLSILVITWFVITCIKYPNVILRIFSSIDILKSFVLPILLFFYWLAGHADMPMSYLMFFACMLIGVFYVEVEDRKALLCISVVALVYISIIAIATLNVYRIKPGISRILAYGDPELVKIYGGASYVTPFIAGYDGIYLIPFILPALDYGRKRATMWGKIVLIWLFILLSVVLLTSQYFIAIILWSVVIIVLLTNINSSHKRIIVGVLFGLGVLFFFIIGPVFLNRIADSGAFSSNITIRLRELANAISGNISNGGDIEARSSLYLMSINTLIEYPIFGLGNINTLYVGYGNHSTILDAFAKFGLLGGIPFLWYYYGPIKEINRRLNIQQRKVYKITTVLFLIFGIINRADTNANYAIIYSVLPALLYTSDNLSNKSNI